MEIIKKELTLRNQVRVHKAYLRSLYNQDNKPVKLMCIKARDEIIERRWNELIDLKIKLETN